MNKGALSLALTFVAVLILALSGYLVPLMVLGPPDANNVAAVTFEITRGQSLNQVAVNLEEQALIRNAMAFRALAKVRGTGRAIKAGFYKIDRAMDAKTVLDTLTGPAAEQVRITIPEGWELKKIAALLEKKGLAKPGEIEAAAANVGPFRERFPWLTLLPEGASLEGFLFPDTYMVSGGAMPAKNLLEMMLARFEQVAWPLVKEHAKPLDSFQIVTLASIVEREAVRAEERPVIAGIFLERLRIGMPLGSCPTAEYASGKHQDAEHNLTLKDISIDSPYNTYKHKGLPPGPIANPGLASLKATLAPQETPYLYFVAKGDGSHQFSRSYKEQLAAQRIYQRH